jgi:hypothetical protein
MQPRKWISMLILTGLMFSLLPSETGSRAAIAQTSQTLTLHPISLVTQRGKTGGTISSLTTKDQSGRLDNPAKYLALLTPTSIYQGYRTYRLPTGDQRGAVSSLTIRGELQGSGPAPRNAGHGMCSIGAQPNGSTQAITLPQLPTIGVC